MDNLKSFMVNISICISENLLLYISIGSVVIFRYQCKTDAIILKFTTAT